MKEEEEIKETRKEEAPKITKENKKEKKLLMETGDYDVIILPLFAVTP